MVHRAKIYTRPDMTIHAFYDASPIIRNYFNRYFNPASTNSSYLSWNTNGYFIDYQMKYGEEYISPITGLPVTIYNQHTTTHRVYNTYLDHMQAGTLNSIPAAFSLLTDRDVDQWWIAPSFHNFIPFRKTTGLNFLIQAVGSGWTSTEGFVSANVPGDLLQYNISKATINALPTGALSDDEERIYVHFTDSFSSQITIRPFLWCDRRYEPMPVTFLNKYGGYETVVFGMINRKMLDVTEGRYEIDPFVLGTASTIPNPPDTTFFVSYARNFNQSTKVYNPQVKSSYKRQALSFTLNSDNLTEKNYKWLQQLIASPEIYIERGGYFYPALITDNKWEEKKGTVDKIFNMTINLTSFDNIYSQYQ